MFIKIKIYIFYIEQGDYIAADITYQTNNNNIFDSKKLIVVRILNNKTLN